jgi:single-stranded DNA-binding protein
MEKEPELYEEQMSAKVLNNLNSVLIEGTIIDGPFMIMKKKSICGFSIESKRYFKHNDTVKETKNYVEIRAAHKLGETTMRLGKKGGKVRIVGALHYGLFGNPAIQNESPHLYLLAEHIEFKTRL